MNPSGGQTILDFEAALALVQRHATQLPRPSYAERLPLLEARGRILAEALHADRDQPPFDRATRDGFAVQAAALTPGCKLRIVGSVRAGSVWAGPALAADEAIEIMTGAPVPPGATAVAMVEHVQRSGDSLTAEPGRGWTEGENIVPRGREACQDAVLLAAGTMLGPAELALAASCGQATLAVFARPRVAIIATGDELVELAETPGPQQIRNSNSYAIAALVEAAGGDAVRLPIAPDTREDIAAILEQARAADLVVLSGGVSMGAYDLVEEVLIAAGARFHFTGVRMQPGRPAVFGDLPATPDRPARFFFGLPGNPISVQVTFQCFAAPMLHALAGAAVVRHHWALARLTEAVAGKPGLTRLLPARLTSTEVQIVPWQGSGDMAANARANCYAELLPGQAYAVGDVTRILLR